MEETLVQGKLRGSILRLVVHANILLSALIRDSVTRRLLVEAPAYLYTPDVMVGEVFAKLGVVSEKNGLSVSDNRRVLDRLLDYVTVVELDRYMPKLQSAYGMMKDIDPKDTPYIALALSFRNDGIWTEDSHFLRQDAVKVWRTKDILSLL